MELLEDGQIISDPSNPRALREAAAEAFSSRIVRLWIAARYATFKGALDETYDVAKKVGVVTASVSGVGTAGYVVWSKVAGSPNIAELIQKVIALM